MTILPNSHQSVPSPRLCAMRSNVVNAITDACYRSIESRRWEPVRLEVWRGSAETSTTMSLVAHDEQYWLIKREHMPDGRTKLILKDRRTGEVLQKVE